MSFDNRLSKLFPVLTACERAILAHRAARTGESAEEISRSVPREQRLEYNRYMALVFIAAHHLGNLIELLARQVEAFEHTVHRMEILDAAAKLLEEDYPEDIAKEPVRPWHKYERSKNKTVTTPYFLRSLAQEIREDLYAELAFRWQEMRGVEIVAEEMSQSLDGEDLLEPQHRTQLEATMETARNLNRRLYARPRRLPEPDQRVMEHSRGLINEGLAALHLLDL